MKSSRRIALSIDIEDWYHLPPITGTLSSKFRDVPIFFSHWNSRYDYLSEPTDRVLCLLKDLELKATFFIVADVVEHYPGLVERIANNGHEIACHGLHHACKINPKTKKPLMTEFEFKEQTITAKGILEKACGQEIIGYRSPNAYVAGWMIDILEEIGFKYDSSVSVNSIYNKTDSRLRNVDTRPYYPAKGELESGSQKRGIIELPWPYFQLIAKFPTGGGPVLRLFGAKYILRGLRESLHRGDSVFYFHPIDMSYESFPLNSSLVQRLFWLVRGQRVENRVKTVLKNANCEITTCRKLITG